MMKVVKLQFITLEKIELRRPYVDKEEIKVISAYI